LSKALGDSAIERKVIRQTLLKDRAGTPAVLNALKTPESKLAIALNAQHAGPPWSRSAARTARRSRSGPLRGIESKTSAAEKKRGKLFAGSASICLLKSTSVEVRVGVIA
jgi:hypothetical protein